MKWHQSLADMTHSLYLSLSFLSLVNGLEAALPPASLNALPLLVKASQYEIAQVPHNSQVADALGQLFF
jgi:hypothetical protein